MPVLSALREMPTWWTLVLISSGSPPVSNRLPAARSTLLRFTPLMVATNVLSPGSISGLLLATCKCLTLVVLTRHVMLCVTVLVDSLLRVVINCPLPGM